MQCVLIFLTVIALGCAFPFDFGEGKQVTVDKDGTIAILGENGKKIVISKAIGHPGPKDIEITTGGGAEGPVKKINVDFETKTKKINYVPPIEADYFNIIDEENREKRSSAAAKETKESYKTSKNAKDMKYKKNNSQYDILSDIFNEYQGIVDKKSYDNFMNKINYFVQSGEVNEGVYDIVRSLDEYRNAKQFGYHVPVNHPPFSYYPAYYYPYRQGYYPTIDQQYYPYYGYGSNVEEVQGVRNYYGQPNDQSFVQYGINRFAPYEQQGYYQKQTQEPQTSDNSFWHSYAQQKFQSKPTWSSPEY